MSHAHPTRRQLLKRSAIGAGLLIGAPAVLPSRLFGAEAPSNRITMGAVGAGSMAGGDVGNFLNDPRVRVVAVADVDLDAAKRMKERIDKHYGNTDCVVHQDFRVMIAKGNLDTITTACPDHWHALIVVTALRAGLDCYSQKPLARSVREGRAMVDAVRRYNRILQVGCQQRSGGEFRTAVELIRNGRLGKLSRIEVGLPAGGGGKKDPDYGTPPASLDWDMWLGPAPWRPYSPSLAKWNWRWCQDFSGGQLTDWMGHHLDIAQWSLGLDRTGPVAIDGKGEYTEGGIYNTAQKYHIRYTYANGQEIDLASSGDHGGFQRQMGVKWYGEKGMIHVDRGRLVGEPMHLIKQRLGAGDLRLPVPRSHYMDFIDSVISRRDPIAPVEAGYAAAATGLLGEISMLVGRPLRWNPETELLADDPAASALLGRTYRQPYTL